MKEYSQLSAIEREPDPTSAGYYLPHHAVTRDESVTTKVRVVFNASAAQRGGRSLNDVIDAGPSLLPDLTGLVLRFRLRPIALHADIRKAFFMVSVKEEDRSYLRFLWLEANGELATWRLTKLPFGVNCSPFLMTAVLNCHLNKAIEEIDPDDRGLIRQLKSCFYVDDCVASIESEKRALRFKRLAIDTLASAGMDLRKWR